MKPFIKYYQPKTPSVRDLEILKWCYERRWIVLVALVVAGVLSHLTSKL